MGITLPPSDEDEPDETTLWPDNVVAARVFEAMLTQWRCGPGGPIGLDYGTPLTRVEKELRLSRRQKRGMFSDLRVMEDEALVWFAEQRTNEQ